MLDYDLVTPKAAYRILTPREVATFVALVERAHAERGVTGPGVRERALATVRELTANRRAGSLFLFERGPDTAGYCILIVRWSNALGGSVLCLDELYVAPAHRGRGIATDFVELLAKIAPAGAVAVELAVPVGNRKAAALAKRLGFSEPPARAAVRPIGPR